MADQVIDMTEEQPQRTKPTALLIGASRGIGLAISQELLRRGWQVVATARQPSPAALLELAARHPESLEIQSLDITSSESIKILAGAMSDRRLDVVFVNAGTTNDLPDQALGEVDMDAFQKVMLTNVLGPMRVIEAFRLRVPADGVIGVMSSGQGSIGNNVQGRRELYRSSKAALNQAMRSYAARQGDAGPALLLLAPGWIRTGLGGPQAPFSLEETIPDIVDVLIARRGQRGLAYLDRFGQPVAW
ncbi:dehydrogenase of unknown specificity, short-chain alcohol dehydrogenase like protein [Frateuria aurantia DSM 6220]|uniref:Short-chain alcohol dehydrogenase n=2 Tax=Frateuria aurantia TaxID=81475 RepID=H8L1T1_FRAAD|nr:dehydrogenase of unknown specificity, short-chain alcohol dehydrogenase like protein [Frateuria aurantia DSM 6220]